ncbi:MAG: YHS domain-containing protein [Spirochaetia bacterium]|nr:YHS domain-containing protein [Spirochaetia bacterium]
MDPVSYFVSGKPIPGKPEFQFEWKGAKWRFANEKNLELFQKNPEQYAPQFGGFCAYAVSQGHTANIDPEAWKIHKGKLYLNYDQKVQKLWESRMEQFIEQANKNWPEVSK